MSYWGEFRVNWKALAASGAGLGAGLLLSIYVHSIFAPHLLQEFGWSRADFALIGTAIGVISISLPIVGRLTDLYGVRPVAAVGVVALPLSFIASSYLNGDLRIYYAIFLFKMLIGTTTTTTVYTRLVAQYFEQSRGMALALIACVPALIGAIGGPILTEYIDVYGWRSGYRAVAVFTAVLGVIALAIMPPSKVIVREVAGKPERTAGAYKSLMGSKIFWIVFGGMVLCNFAQSLQGTNLKLMLLETGITADSATYMVSVYAIGVVIGRLCCGVALDRFPTHIVAAICMGIPAIGLFILSSGWSATAAIFVAILLIGFSQGAEGDVVAFLSVRYFGLGLFSTVMGLMVGGLGATAAIGSLVLSLTLEQTNSYTSFIFLAAMTVTFGSSLFLLLGHRRFSCPPAAPREAALEAA